MPPLPCAGMGAEKAEAAAQLATPAPSGSAALHCVHATAPAAEKVPAGQARQDVAAEEGA